MGAERASNGIFKVLTIPLFCMSQFGNAENIDRSDQSLQSLFLTHEEKGAQQRSNDLKTDQQERISNVSLLSENRSSRRVVEYTGYLHIKDKVTLFFGLLPAKKYKIQNAPHSRSTLNVSSQHYVLKRYKSEGAKAVVFVGSNNASETGVSTIYKPFTVESVSTDLKTASIKLTHNGQQKTLNLSR